MVAKHDAAQHSLMAQLKARRVRKTYQALVAGQRGRRRRAHRGADRARPEAPDPDGGRARRPALDDRLPGPRAVRRLDPARARPRDRADPPDPRPPRRHRPSGRRATRCTGPARRGAGRTVSIGCSSTPGGWSSRRRATATSSGRRRRCPTSSRRCSRGCAGRRPAVERIAAAGIGAVGGSSRRTSRDDPGRPDGVIEGAPGAMLVIISGPSGVGKDTIIDAMRRRARVGTPGEYHYVVTCTTRRRGRARSTASTTTSSTATRSCASGATAQLPRGERGPRQLVRLAARPGPRGAAGRQGRHPQDRRPGRPDRQGAGLRGAPHLRRPAVARDALRPPAGARDRDRRRARAPPAQRGHRARPPGRLRLRRRQRDRPGRADRRADRRDHRRGARSATRTGGSGSRPA